MSQVDEHHSENEEVSEHHQKEAEGSHDEGNHSRPEPRARCHGWQRLAASGYLAIGYLYELRTTLRTTELP